MKRQHKRGIRIQNRIIISALLLAIQILFLFATLYDFSLGSAWSFVVSGLLGAVTVVLILNKRGNPDHKVGWIIFILIFPIFGISVYLLWGGGRVLPHLKKRMRICEAHYFQYLNDNEEAQEKMKYFDISHSRQADYLTNESAFPIYDNTSAEYLPSGERFFSCASSLSFKY